jgi:hypothetical protein
VPATVARSAIGILQVQDCALVWQVGEASIQIQHQQGIEGTDEWKMQVMLTGDEL